MKKAFVLLLTLVGLLSFVGCAAGYDSVTDTNYGREGYYYNRGYGTDYDSTYDGVNGYNRATTYNRAGYSTYNGSGANNTGVTY